MNPDELPENVRLLLSSQVESYEVLAILMFLWRERARGSSEAQLSAALKMPTELVVPAIESLLLERLIGVHPAASGRSYIYLPATPEIDAAVAQLVLEYETTPVRIINFMTANAIGRVRKSALHVFAEVFVLKNDIEGG